MKVLMLAVPLSFVLGIGVSYYLDQKQRNPVFLRARLNLLTTADLQWKSLQPLVNTHSSAVIEVIECRTHQDCKTQIENQKIDVAILPYTLVKDLIQRDRLHSIKTETRALRDLLHVDFRSPMADPEGRFSLPLFWNILGFLCHHSMCDLLNYESLKDVPKDQRSSFVFLDTETETLALKERGLWPGYQDHRQTALKRLIDESRRSLIQWPSGALTRAELLEIKEYSYQLPKFGASLVVYGAVLPKNPDSDKTKALEFLKELLSKKTLSHLHSEMKFALTTQVDEDFEKQLDPNQRPQRLRTFELNRLRFKDFSKP